MAEITTKENETGEIVIETASKPNVLSEEQKVVFTDLIKTNTPYLQDQISQVKRDFPEEFASVSPFSDSEISEFSDLRTFFTPFNVIPFIFNKYLIFFNKLIDCSS